MQLNGLTDELTASIGVEQLWRLGPISAVAGLLAAGVSARHQGSTPAMMTLLSARTEMQSAFWILERLGDLKDEGRAATLDTLLTASVRRDSTATPDVIVPIVKWMTAVGLLAKRATA